MSLQRGQATVEFVALLLLCCLAFGALLALKVGFDGRPLGGFLARHIVCAVGGRCDRDERRLAEAYGTRDAAAVRALAPSLAYEPGERELPVDWRRCRRVSCSEAPDDRMLDAHLARCPSCSAFAVEVTAFTEDLPGRARCLVAHPANPPYLIPVVELSGAP